MADVSRDGNFYLAFRPRIPHALVLGLAVALMDTLRAYPILVTEGPTGGWPRMLLHLAIGSALGACIMIAAITWAALVRVPVRKRIPVVGITVLGAAVVATSLKIVLAMMNEGDTPGDGNLDEWIALGLYEFWMICATGALAALYYEFWERAAKSTTRLRDAELERQGIEQRVVESRLSVLKARIEPAFLFSSLATVQTLYRANTDAAEQLLDDLIVYLRAALPQMRGTNSSLGDEVHLATAYLKLHDDAFEGRLHATFDVPEGSRRIQFPPMVLLPLVEDAIQRARTMSRPALALQIAVTVESASLHVVIQDDCPLTRVAAVEDPALAAPEHALAAFFGDSARFVRGARTNGGTRITFQIPL